MFATRILEVGYPKVHGPRNVLYEFGARLSRRRQGIARRLHRKDLGRLLLRRARACGGRSAWRIRRRAPFACGCPSRWRAPPGSASGSGACCRRYRAGGAACFAACYFALCALSISLLLHLREARYYPLLVLALGALLALHLRAVALHALAWRRYAVATALLLPLLFQVFYVAWFPLLAWCAADAAREAWRGADAATRAARGARARTAHGRRAADRPGADLLRDVRRGGALRGRAGRRPRALDLESRRRARALPAPRVAGRGAARASSRGERWRGAPPKARARRRAPRARSPRGSAASRPATRPSAA